MNSQGSSNSSLAVRVTRAIVTLFLLNALHYDIVSAVKSTPVSLIASSSCIRKRDCTHGELSLKIRGGQQNDRYYDYNDDDDDYRYDNNGRRPSRSSSSNRYYDNENNDYQQNYNDNGGEHDEDYYGRDGYDYNEGDYGSNRGRSSSKSKSSFLPSSGMMPDIVRTGNKKVGFMLLGSGGVLTMLGVSLFFNKSLMRLGNILFIAGVPMTLGPGRTVGYFLQPKKARATGCLIAGIFLVMVGWPVFGIALEIFGLLNLFGNMFPVLMVLLKQLPIVGNLLNNDSKKAAPRRNQSPRYDDDYYRNDDDQNYEDGDASRYY